MRIHRQRGGHVCEPLEQRKLLSTINWINKGTGGGGGDTDDFNSLYGASATTARNIVQRAIDDWERVITNFNGTGGRNTYDLTIDAQALGPGGRGSTGSIVYDASNKPQSATIQLDDNGGGEGWYFDPVIGTATVPDDGEFVNLVTPFMATFTGAGGASDDDDFYRTIVHEIGHAMGLASNATRLTSIDTDIGDDPNSADPAERLFTIDVNGVAGADYCYTNDGGFHLYEGPSVGGNPIHPNDLMNSGRTVGAPPTTRQLIGDTITTLLRDVFNYTVTLPSLINTFYANLNTSTNVVTVTGDINVDGTNEDFIDLELTGTNAGDLRVEANGSSEIFPDAEYTTIVVNSGLASDDVDVDELESGKTVTVNLGDADDRLDVTQEFEDIDTNLSSNFTANGNAGTDIIEFHDIQDGFSGDDYTITTTTLAKNGASRVVTYGTMESMIIDGSPFGSDYDINSLSSTLTSGLTINAGALNDTITLGGTFGDIDSFINAGVAVHGNGGTDALIINDSVDNVGDSYTLTSTTFDKNTTTVLFTYATVESVTLDANIDGNAINVLSTSVPTTVNGNNGGDVITVGDGDWDTNLLANLTVHGGTDASTDSLVIDDSTDTVADNYTVNSASATKSSTAVTISYPSHEFERHVLSANNSANTITVNSAFESYTIDANGGVDTILVVGNEFGTFLSLDTGAGLDNVSVNTDGSGWAGVAFGSTQDLALLHVFNEGNVRVTSGGNKVLYTQALTIDATGKLDLTNEDMIVDYLPGPSPLATIRGDLTTGYAAGAWTGNGINSATAAANAAKTTALGYAESSNVLGGGGGVFSGIAVDATAVLVKYTWYGDADLTGAVDVADLGRLASNWQLSPRDWSAGNFDYDAIRLVDVNDLGLLATNWQAGVGSPLAPSIASALDELAGSQLISARRATLVKSTVLQLKTRQTRVPIGEIVLS
jgi:hypothetical protein